MAHVLYILIDRITALPLSLSSKDHNLIQTHNDLSGA